MTGILMLLVLYGGVQLLRQTGVYDLTRWWASPPPPVRFSDLDKTRAPAAPTAPAAGYLRDQPPRPPATNLPQFTIRDGEQYDFMLDLDAETLKRLAEIQGQLDGLGALTRQLRAAAQTLTDTGSQQRQQDTLYQQRMLQDVAAARREIAALQVAVGEMEARFKRASAGQGLAYSPAAAPAASGRPLPGWSVKAISGDRAWLRSPKGQEVTVVAGERLQAAGTVRSVDSLRNVVTMSDGRVVR